jgi:hypothetical protein
MNGIWLVQQLVNGPEGGYLAKISLQSVFGHLPLQVSSPVIPDWTSGGPGVDSRAWHVGWHGFGLG